MSEELLVRFDAGRAHRVLVCPAWFDEANKLRRFTLEVMRRLNAVGIDSFLPDLPGCNESLAPLDEQTLAGWRAALDAAAHSFAATYVLAIRAGALLAPQALPGWRYAPQSGPKLLRALIRARTVASREAGLAETSEALLDRGRKQGLMLGGWMIGPLMLREIESAELTASEDQRDIAPSELGGADLWLRAEPSEDPGQASALAGVLLGEAEAKP
jgi:hypothetical protein